METKFSLGFKDSLSSEHMWVTIYLSRMYNVFINVFIYPLCQPLFWASDQDTGGERVGMVAGVEEAGSCLGE